MRNGHLGDKMSEEKKPAVAETVVKQEPSTMSHRQLSAELRRLSNQSYTGAKGFVMNGVDFGDRKTKNRAGLSNAWGVVLGIVLNDTKIVSVRKDQVGPGKLNPYPV